ncbi:protein kinase domain-containing protein [Amycolatopsis sp. NPDC003865]
MEEANPGRMLWRARIRDDEHRVRGGGVLLGSRHVLTCAHVLGGGPSPPSGVLVDFVGLPGRPAAGARVVEGGWVPARQDGLGDLALLELEKPVEPGTGAVLRRIPGLTSRDVRVFGFPPGADYGIWWSGRVLGPGGPGGRWTQLDVEGPLEPGSSGCAVVDTTTGRPLGIVVATAGQRTALMIPAAEIVRQLPRVAEWVVTESVLEERLDQLVLRTRGRLGGDTDELHVSLPKAALPEPSEVLLTDPSVRENLRFCETCGHPVGRGRDGAPGRDRGFCPTCGAAFTFTPELAAGDLVAGRYRVRGCLAHGGFSWIYLAWDEALDRLVVLKGLIGSRAAAADLWTAAARRTLPHLDHPNVVRAFEFVEHFEPSTGRETGYLVMEYVPGLSLRSVIRRAKRLRPEHVATYGLQILDALGYLHEQGLLYCDMKPDNVLQTGDRIKVIDLGAVRAIGDHESPVIGTRHYQPPSEELRDHGVTVRTDLFTVGTTLRELLRACEGPASDVGWEALELVIARATAPYDERFGDAAEMAAQLRGVLRQILSLRDHVPHPAPSDVFTPAPDPLIGGLGVPPWEDLATNPFADCSTVPPGHRMAGALPRVRPERSETEPARWWTRALDDLANSDNRQAEAGFRRCAELGPGEQAPWLALGFCAESRGDAAEARRCFQAVWARDRGEVAAAFGLARTRLAEGDRVGAAAVLDDAADVVEARIAAIRALAAVLPGAGPPSPGHVATALQRLSRAGSTGEVHDRLAAVVLETALLVRTTDPETASRLPAVRELQDQLYGIYRTAARTTASRSLRRVLTGRANRFRRLGRRVPAPAVEVAVHQNKFLPLDATEVPVIVTVSASGPVRDLTLVVTTATAHRLGSAREVHPVLSELSPAVSGTTSVFGLGTWTAGESRDYALTFVAGPRAPVGEDVVLAEVTAVSGQARSSAQPVLGHWTAELRQPDRAGPAAAVLADQAALAEALEIAMAAFQAGDPGEALDALGNAVAMAAEQRNDDVLRRLNRLVDIVDAETGLVSFRDATAYAERNEGDFFSERLSVPLREAELVGSGLVTSVRVSARLETGVSEAIKMLEFAEPESPRRLPAVPPQVGGGALRARVECRTDGPIVPGRPARVSVAFHREEPFAPLTEPVRLRVLLDTASGLVEPVSRTAWLTVDRRTDPVEFDVVPAEPGSLRLAFRVYRDFDTHLLLEITAELPVERKEAWS